MVKIIFIIIKVIIIIILFRVKMIVTATLVYLVVTTDSNAFLDRRNKQTNYNAKEKKCKTFPEIAYCAVIFSIAVFFKNIHNNTSVYSTDFKDSTISIFLSLKYITKLTIAVNSTVSKILAR